MKEENRLDDRVDDELRRWGSRPPATPPQVAAARLRERLRREPVRSRVAGWRALMAPAAAAALVVAAMILRFSSPLAVDSAAWEPVPVDSGVVLIPLEDGTTLYLTLGPN